MVAYSGEYGEYGAAWFTGASFPTASLLVVQFIVDQSKVRHNSLMMKQKTRIPIPEEEIRAFCEKNHIRKLALFGSVLRDDFRADSDVDVLVEFEPGHVPGFEFFAMQDELSAILGRDVDLSTPGFLSPHIRDDVESETLVEYVKA